MSEARERGFITIKVPLYEVVDEGTYENPGPEYWLEYGEAELIEHDIDDDTLGWMSHEIRDGDMMANFEMPKALKELADAVYEAEPISAPIALNLFTSH